MAAFLEHWQQQQTSVHGRQASRLAAALVGEGGTRPPMIYAKPSRETFLAQIFARTGLLEAVEAGEPEAVRQTELWNGYRTGTHGLSYWVDWAERVGAGSEIRFWPLA